MFTGSLFAPLSRDCLVVPDVSSVTVIPGSPEETQAMVGISCAHFSPSLSSLVAWDDEFWGRISCFCVITPFLPSVLCTRGWHASPAHPVLPLGDFCFFGLAVLKPG